MVLPVAVNDPAIKHVFCMGPFTDIEYLILASVMGVQKLFDLQQ